MQEREFAPRDVRDEEEAASDQEEEQRNDSVEQIRRRAAKIEPGESGDCELCGRYFTRVVSREYKGSRLLACGGCRDTHKIG
jgi:hypothetical protein